MMPSLYRGSTLGRKARLVGKPMIQLRGSRQDDVPQLSSAFNLSLDVGRSILSTCSRVYTPEQRIKLDDRDDSVFFEQPRLMLHIDTHFQQQLQGLYHAELQQYHPGARILDLCSAAHSHLPPVFHSATSPSTSATTTSATSSSSPPAYLPPAGVLGHGMNTEELAANPALQGWFTQDLNRRTALDLPSGHFHAALCCCGVQYLQWPEEVFAEVLRILQPGGPFIVSFSAACWAEKATAGWLTCGMEERLQLVCRFLEAAGFEVAASQLVMPGETSGSPSSTTTTTAATSTTPTVDHDPFGWVVGRRPLSRPDTGLAEPADLARELVPPPLAELDLRQEDYVSDATLERWRGAYQVMVAEARQLGIPARAIPQLPADADAATVKHMRDHLQDMLASFLSAGL